MRYNKNIYFFEIFSLVFYFLITQSMQGGTIFAFIDSQNLNKSIQKQGWQLDYARFRVYLKEKYQVQKAFLFYGYLERYKKMYSFLERCGYSIIFKPTVFGPE